VVTDVDGRKRVEGAGELVEEDLAVKRELGAVTGAVEATVGFVVLEEASLD